MLRVQSTPCETCIYKSTSPLNIKKLEAEVADPRDRGFFASHRVCHHSRDAVCRGFWNRHKDSFTLGQVAQRLDCVEFVSDDTLKEKS